MVKKQRKPDPVDNVHWLKERSEDGMHSTIDSWANAVTGMGVPGKDKSTATRFFRGHTLSRQELDDLGRQDGLARKIIGRVVDDALRSGWVVTFKGDETKEVTPEEAIDLNERLVTWYKSVRLKRGISQHLKQARQYGGSLLVLGAMDGQRPEQPLDVEKVTEFSFVRALDRWQTDTAGIIDARPDSPHFGFPLIYGLHSVFTHFFRGAGVPESEGGEGVQISQAPTLQQTRVHTSRVWRTDGVMLSDRVRQQNQGWGDSVLEAAFDPLANWSSAMAGSGTIIQDYTQGVYKIKDMSSIINANGQELVRKRFQVMDYVKSIWNAIMVDADNEDYTRTTTSVTGLSELLDRFGMHLSAVADMPLTLLFGVSPGGFGTGEAEGSNWDDTVKAYQTDFVEPLLEYVLTILFATPEFSDFPANWSIKFNSLQLADPLQEADIRLKTSQADALDIQNGVLSSDEVAISRFGGSAYSTETALDETAREMDARLAEEGLGGVGVEALNGIQIRSLLDILERVKTGLLPKESASSVIAASFPDLAKNPAAVSTMLDPIEVTGPLPGTPPAPLATPPFAAPQPADGQGNGNGDEEPETSTNQPSDGEDDD